jgi:hypothetical protein
MPATAAALVRQQKRMRIWLQARQHTLTRRGNLRFLPNMPTEVDTCRKLTVPKLQAVVDALKCLQAKTAAKLDALLPAILNTAFKGEL